jgi:hypothetical protein
VAHHHHPERVRHERMDMIIAVYAANILANEHAPNPPDSQAFVYDTIDRSILESVGEADRLEELHKVAEEATHEPQQASRSR